MITCWFTAALLSFPGALLSFLAHTLKASSVRSYLNIIGILHKEFGLPNPLLNNWPLKSLLRGINRPKGLSPNQKQPITPAILQQLHSTLSLSSKRFRRAFLLLEPFFAFWLCKNWGERNTDGSSGEGEGRREKETLARKRHDFEKRPFDTFAVE